jgi:hypothetical protein
MTAASRGGWHPSLRSMAWRARARRRWGGTGHNAASRQCWRPLEPAWRRGRLVRWRVSAPMPPGRVRRRGAAGARRGGAAATRAGGLAPFDARRWTGGCRPRPLARWACTLRAVVRAGAVAVDARPNRPPSQGPSRLTAVQASRGLRFRARSRRDDACSGASGEPCSRGPSRSAPGRAGGGGIRAAPHTITTSIRGHERHHDHGRTSACSRMLVGHRLTCPDEWRTSSVTMISERLSGVYQ